MTSSNLAWAAEEVRPIPAGFKLESVIQGASTIAPFDMTVVANERDVTFNWRAVCFPRCSPDLKIEALKSFFSAFGLTDEALAGVDQINLKFERGPNVRCVQSVRELAALQCFVATGREPNIHLSFGKVNGTIISMDQYLTGHFRSQVATRVTWILGRGSVCLFEL